MLKECLYRIIVTFDLLILITSLNPTLSANHSAHSSGLVPKTCPHIKLSGGLQHYQRKAHSAVSLHTHSHSSCSFSTFGAGHHPPHQGPRQTREGKHSFP